MDFKSFIERIEAKISPGAMIYVMPYLPFPESAPRHEEGYNGLLRPYFYSVHARWSYGAIKGRPGDAWIRQVEALPMPERIAALRQTGFEGIYIDRSAFQDNGAKIEDELKSAVNSQGLESFDRKQVFYAIEPAPSPQVTPAFFESLGRGFYPTETGSEGRWVWAGREGRYLLYNFSERNLKINFSAAALGIDGRKLSIELGSDTLTTVMLNNTAPTTLSLVIDLPPGVTQLKLRTDRPPVKLPTDPRSFGFRLINPSVKTQ